MGKRRGEGEAITPPRTTLTAEVESLLERFSLDEDTLRIIMSLLEDEMEKGLDPKTHDLSDLKMIHSFVRNLPDGTERGRVLALDLGGTNFRILEVNLIDSDHVDINPKIFMIPQRYLNSEGTELFDYLASSLANFMKTRKLSGVQGPPIPCGFTFSFPCDQKSLDSAELISWTKGFTCDGVVGEDVVRMMQEAIDRRGDIRVKIMALINDTVGTLMTCAHRDSNCSIGVIFGTGTNACYVENLEKVKRWEDPGPGSNQVIINMEWGAFGDGGCLDFIRTNYDKTLDENSVNPGKQKFEKMISGMYMGQLARTIMFDFIDKRIMFPGLLSKHQEEIGSAKLTASHLSFQSKEVSDIETDQGLKFNRAKEFLEENGFEPDYNDCHVLQRICELVSERAATLAAAAIAVLINRIGKPNVTVGIDGSLFRHHPNFKPRMDAMLSTLVNRGINYRLMLSEDGSGKGAALVAAVANRLTGAGDSKHDSHLSIRSETWPEFHRDAANGHDEFNFHTE
ncbi:hypothetical protein ACOME3_005005 [Neoechinorhynchus agilis]